MKLVAITLVTLAGLALGTIACAQQPRQPSEVSALAAVQESIARHDSAEAVRQLDQLLKRSPELAQGYYLRGRERFRLGKFQESLADFNRYVELRPEQKSRQWERGITCYFAEQYAEGERQFALYQTYHDQDVENSVWRYLCMAQTSSAEEARAQLLPIERDSRVPMMEIYRMYRGELSPNDVLAAARAGGPTPAVLRGRLFYANLYIGLYLQSLGKTEEAGPYLKSAADPENASAAGVNRYMWDVARVSVAPS